MKRRLLMILSIVALLAGNLSHSAAASTASSFDCYIDVRAVVEANASTGSRAVDVIVLPDCSTVVGEPRALTPTELKPVGPAALTPQQTCTWANRLIGAGGEGDILTAVNITQSFFYDFFYVTSASYNATTYVHWSTGWGVISSWKQQVTTPPVPTHQVNAGASFSWSGPWHHDKTTYSYSHADGSCTGDFWHNGYVCLGCAVRFYIFYV